MLRPRGQNFGLSLGLDKLALALALSIWPRPRLGFVNMALKNVLSDAKIISVLSISWLYHSRRNIYSSPTLNTVLYKKTCQHCANNISLLAKFQSGAR